MILSLHSLFCFVLTNWPSLVQLVNCYVSMSVCAYSMQDYVKRIFCQKKEKIERKKKDKDEKSKKGTEMILLLIFTHIQCMYSHLLVHLCTRFVFFLITSTFWIKQHSLKERTYTQREEMRRRRRRLLILFDKINCTVKKATSINHC